MKNHTRLYLNDMGYSTADVIPCEVCSAQAVDIHHIKARGMGGSQELDTIDNLMALCRKCHTEYGDVPNLRQLLADIHNKHIRQRLRFKKNQVGTPRAKPQGYGAKDSRPFASSKIFKKHG